MSKLCPNCGANSPNNAKHCMDCGYSLENVTPTDDEGSSANSTFPMKSILVIAVIIIIIAAISFDVLTPSAPENVTVSISKAECTDGTSSNEIYYYYSVSGFIDHKPGDADKYLVKTLFCDSDGKELVSTTEKLSQFNANSKYDTLIGYYATKNYIDVDHVVVQIVKDGNVINEFNKTMNTNKLTQNNATNST